MRVLKFVLAALSLVGLAVSLISPARGASTASAVIPFDLVAMVSTVSGPGAGLVVGQSDVRTVIVTARHLLVQEDYTIATDGISVEFNSLRGTPFQARVVEEYVDEGLDIAVLFIDHNNDRVPRLAAERFEESVSPTSPLALRGESVQVVGAAGGRQWSVSPPGDVITGVDGSRLLISSTGTRPGDSGGGVFDVFGRLLGLVSEYDVSTGELRVVSINEVRRRLQQWRIEFMLGTAGVPTGGPKLLDAMRKQAHLTATLDGDDPHGPLTFRVEMSSSLKRLQPTFRVEFPEYVSLEAIHLRDPAFEAHASLPPFELTAEFWMDTPDGRHTGPIEHKFNIKALAEEKVRRKLPLLDETASAIEKNRRDYALAMEEASLKNASDSFWMAENHARESKAKQAKFEGEFASQLAQVFRDRIMREVPAQIERMEARCVIPPEATWLCQIDGVFHYPASWGRLDDLIRSIRVGQRSTIREGVLPPLVELRLDRPDAVVDEIKLAVERTLAEGAKAVHIDVVFSSGQRVGPRILCGIGDGPVNSRRCRPLQVNSK